MLNEEKSIESKGESEHEEEHEQSDENELFESPLGTKEYWDKFYNKEINQFNNNTDLIGEIWFGQHVQKKILNYVSNKFKSDFKISILDIGCGNAAFLIDLYRLGFKNLTGMDYSEKSIELAKNILSYKYGEEVFSQIKLYSEDINLPVSNYTKFDLIHDKGTFDAFMLLKENNERSYIKYIIEKSKENANPTIFIITSCNHSHSELKNFFIFEETKFNLIEEIPHKTFNFGGQLGQTKSKKDIGVDPTVQTQGANFKICQGSHIFCKSIQEVKSKETINLKKLDQPNQKKLQLNSRFNLLKRHLLMVLKISGIEIKEASIFRNQANKSMKIKGISKLNCRLKII